MHPGHVSAWSIAPLPDGKLLVNGDFRLISGHESLWLARLSADGSFDPTFDLGSLTGTRLGFLARYDDGRLLFSARYTNGLGGPYTLVRLGADGAFDAAFASLSDNGSVTAVAFQPDGKLVIGGSFWLIDGVQRRYLARLNADGTLDPSFVPAPLEIGDDWFITGVGVQTDGKIVVAGHIFDVPWETYYGIARLNPNGSEDTVFRSRVRVDGPVFRMLLQPDDKIVINGGFGNVNGVNRPHLARLNADGTPDTSFNPPPAYFDGPSSFAHTMTLAPDGKLLVATDRALLRLNPDGSQDGVFQCAVERGFWSGGVIDGVAVEPDGDVLISGGFKSVNGIPAPPLVRLYGGVTSVAPAPGSVDLAFDPGMGPGSRWPRPEILAAIVPQPDGRILIGGSFATYDGVPRSGLARVNADGSLDPSFGLQLGETWFGDYGEVRVIALQPDGKVLIGGLFTSVNGIARTNFARLNADGSLDVSFDPSFAPFAFYPDHQAASVTAIALHPDGTILVSVGHDDSSIFRFRADGSTGPSPGPPIPPCIPGIEFAIPDDCAINTLAVQSDGRILYGGSIFQMPPGAVNYQVGVIIGLVRFNADNCLDTSFTPRVRANGPVEQIVVQPDDRILLRGCFTEISGVPRRGLARLNADGTVDPSFQPPSSPTQWPAFALAPDGRLTFANSVQLNPDGSVNERFQAQLETPGTDWSESAVAVQADGKVLLSGNFTAVNGVPRPGFARLHGDLTPIAPVLAASLASQTKFTGQTATFTVSAAGTAPLSYQWLFNGSPIPGATAAVLSLGNAQPIQAGSYAVVVSNSSGSVTSAPARLELLSPPGGPGSVDLTFDPTAGSELPGLGSTEKEIYALLEQPDGQVVIAGNFLGLNGALRRHLARIDANGRLDEAFNNSFGPDGPVQAVALQPDGKLIVGGTFGAFDSEARRSVARLNPDGTLDRTFFVDVRFDDREGSVRAVAVQPDGRILIGGSFRSVNDLERTNLIRLYADGSLDHNFDPPPAFESQYGSVDIVRVLPDGKLLVGGSMGAQRRLLHRLNPDGSEDTSFAHELVGYWLRHLAGRSDGKMYAAGEIDVTGSGNSGPALVLVNAEGTLDRSYHVDLGGAGLLAMEVQADDRLVISGWFQSVNGADRKRIARLNPDGTVDESFDPGHSLNYEWRQPSFTAIAVGAGGRIWLGGQMRLEGGTKPGTATALVRLQADGRIDETFHAQAGRTTIAGSAVHVAAMALQSDGRLFVGGQFDSYNNAPRANLARVLPDGRLDHSFQPRWGDGLSVSALALQPDGQLIVGGSGSFVAWDGSSDRSHAGLARLKPDGQVDTSFHNYWSEWSMRVLCLALQPDGKILVGGEFENGLARFEADGRLDPTFHPPTLPAYDGDAVHAVVVQPDGRILVGGSSAIGLFRLRPDGTWDRDLVSGVQVGGTVTTMLLQPDGRLLVALTAGWVSGSDHTPCGKLVRLGPEGSLDTRFNTTLVEAPTALARLADGRILAAESIGSPGRYTRLHRLHPGGSSDTGFQARVRHDAGSGMIAALFVQPDGQVLVGGSFSSVNELPADGLARLNPGPSVREPFVQRHLTSRFYVPGGATYEVMLYAHPPPGVSAFAAEDRPPTGWTVSAISDGGVFDATTGKVKFGPFFDDDGRMLVYEVTPAAGATNAQCFDGVASADGVDTPILGEACMLPAVPHPADTVPPGWRLAIGEWMPRRARCWFGGVSRSISPTPLTACSPATVRRRFLQGTRSRSVTSRRWWRGRC
jgi:uncharacterized delta-60 repeat protein